MEELSRKEAIKIFNEFSKKENMRNGFIKDGCYERAQKICKDLEKRGYPSLYVII